MEPDAVLIIVGVLLVGLSAVFAVLAVKFRSLRGTVIISIGEMGALMLLLAKYDEIESDDEKIARLLKMSPEEVKTELEKGHMMKLISMKAASIMATMKSAVPEADRLFRQAEYELERR